MGATLPLGLKKQMVLNNFMILNNKNYSLGMLMVMLERRDSEYRDQWEGATTAAQKWPPLYAKAVTDEWGDMARKHAGT
jgi:hypothetical protein